MNFLTMLKRNLWKNGKIEQYKERETMTLLEHFKDPYFWEIFLLDLGLATIGIIFLLLFIFVIGKLDQWQNKS
jgi:hypothetical protein